MRRGTRLAAAIALLAGPSLVVLSQSPAADAAVNDQTISGTASTMWQTNDTVETLATANGVVYAGGLFTKARPSGTSTGSSQEVTRTYLAAFSASTGALVTSFNFTLNGKVNSLAVSPDKDTLYVGGSFTTVNGSTRNHVAAIDLSSTSLATFNPNANKNVTAVTATASRVYLSGDFTTVGGTSKPTIASVYSRTATDGTAGAVVTGFGATMTAPAPSMFTTSPSPRAITMLVSPNGQRLLIGGGFDTVDGTLTGGLASLDPATGAVQSWPANSVQPINTSCSGRTRDIVTDGTSIYVTAEGDPPGCYEGTYRADGNGNLIWNSTCLGASQGLVVLHSILYKGSHQHDCAFNVGDARGGFVGGLSRSDFIHQELTGQNVADGSFVHWTPQTNGGGTTNVGPHAMATDGTQIFVGGDFTTINGSAQQGLARFAAGGNTATPAIPGRNRNGDPFTGATAVLAGNYAVTVTPTAANTLTVEVPAVEDIDNGTLTYRIYRDGGTTPVSTQTVLSYPWSRPVIRFDDTGLTAGSTHTYKVSASDGTHTSTQSSSVSGKVASAKPAAYSTAVTGTAPQLFWRLNGTGTTQSDSSGHGHNGSTHGGVTTGATGAINGDTAVTLNGSTGYVASTSTIAAPNAFSESAWFKTTTTSGGSILAMSDTQTGSGGNTDRTITMDNNGNLVFGVKGNAPASPFGPSTISIRNQGVIWNDGKWHQVVGTYDGNGVISLYVDGRLQMSQTGTLDDSTVRAAGQATSYVRAGYSDLSTMQLVFGLNFYNQKWPASQFFNGSVDEVSAWSTALTAAQVQTLFASGVGGQ